MRPEELQSEPSEERLQEALDRLGTLVAPASAAENDLVARVMSRIHEAAPAARPLRRWLMRIAVAAAACLLAALVLWRTNPVRTVPPTIAAGARQGGPVATAPLLIASQSPAASPAPVMRRSTWSTVTESVVLEGDMPVRKLLYREFEQVELLDADGNPQSHLIVPTKAMLVATNERY